MASAYSQDLRDRVIDAVVRCPVYVNFVEEPPVLAPALGICGASNGIFASVLASKNFTSSDQMID
jgi:hypothetical protein